MSTASPFQSPATIQSLTRWDEDPALYLFTSLTAGSSHIITATARIGTILKAAQIPYVAVDTATDESARKLWGRRAKGKKLPGLVKEGFVIADLEEVEEWNEFGELEDNIGPVPDPSTTSTTAGTGKPLNVTKSSNSSGTTAAAATASTTSSKPPLSSEASAAETTTIVSGNSMKLPIRQLADEVAEKATLKNSAASSTKWEGSGPGNENEEVTEKSNLTSDEKSDVKPEPTSEAKPNSNSTGDSSGDAATTTAIPATKDETKNKIQLSSDSKNTSSKPEDAHESSSTSKDEYARDVAAKENENENENENGEKSKQSSTNEADKETTILPNSEETQSDMKRDAAEAHKSIGGEESKDEAGDSSKDRNNGPKDKENRTEARSEAKAVGENETIKPQVQDAKSAEAAGVSNMD